MDDKKLGFVESKFADIIWQHEPISSGELVKHCETELHWKKPTTYTVLRKLKTKGAVRHEEATVSVVLTREEAIREESRHLEQWAGGFTPFMAAFMGGRKLTAKEAEELKKLIDEKMGEE